jgi:flagellum-specific peptidoglycan hydrolase FlgJ
MGKSGYATDPEYANKLNQILHSDTLQAAMAARVAAL